MKELLEFFNDYYDPYNPEFKHNKLVATYTYILQYTNSIDKILRIIELADKLHMNRYGRMIYTETYVHYKEDFIPLRMINYIIETQDLDIILESPYINAQYYEKPNLDYFSESDLHCLDQAIKIICN